MAVNALCAFGILALLCATPAVSDEPNTDIKCELFVIRSIEYTPKKQRITDDNGRPADIVSIKVKQKLSSAKCEIDKTFLISGSDVLVLSNCKAQFEVCYKTFRDPEPTVRPGCQLVRLLSRQNRDVEEELESNIISMRVLTQFTEGIACKKNENYGFEGKTAFAKDGCRADFEVCLKDSPDPQDTVCKNLVLRSTLRTADVRMVYDQEGDVATIVSVDLLKQLSDVECVEWKTFLYNETAVTAKRGCEGRFKVCYVSNSPGSEPTSPTGCFNVRLLSKQNESARKKLVNRAGDILSIRVHRQFPTVVCILDKNFGIRGTDVYASGGCKADFQVCIRGPVLVTDSPETTCVNIGLASWGKKEPDWKKVTGRGGAAVKIISIRLLRQESDEVCLLGDSFFISGVDEVQATNGCKGNFRVCYIFRNP